MLSVIGETQLAGARRATIISLLSAACEAVRFFVPWRRFPSINDAAGVEAMLCCVQDELLLDVEERKPGRDPLQQLHRKELQRRSVRTLHFLQHPAQQWRWKAGRPLSVSVEDEVQARDPQEVCTAEKHQIQGSCV